MVDSNSCKLRIGLLGPFYLEVDGEEVETGVWKSKKALTILKYLATKHGQKVPSDVLIELLWPDNGNVDNISNLHTAIWFVRHILAPLRDPKTNSRLRYANGSYWLQLGDDGCVDIHRFEHHVKAARQYEDSDPEKALSHCESALQLYRNDFLSEAMYDDWTFTYREDYKELYFENAQRMASLLYKHKGDFKGAATLVYDALRKNPSREELYQAGIKALISDKRYGDAILLYKKCEQILMEEFQLTPSPATQELIISMKRNLTEETIIESLNFETEPANGAYACDRTMLQTIINMEQRRFIRNGLSFSIHVISYEQNNGQMRQFKDIFHILQRSLRKSDVICQWSSEKIVVFMPETNAHHSQAAYERFQDILQGRLGNTLTLIYDILDSEALASMQTKLLSILSS